ncbi:MAG: hypothetical protein Q9167_004572 [Letrouitia subvulpina]
MKDPRMGNNVCNDRNKLSRNVIILERKKDEWYERLWEVGNQPWDNSGNAEEYAIIANYLDIDFIQSVVEGLEIDLKAFRSHLNGCEQHYKGDWAKSSFTFPPYPRSVQYRSRYVCIDFRRPYLIKDEASFSAFNVSRKQRCSLLRSHRRARTANVLFEHERCTIAWSPVENEGSKPLEDQVEHDFWDKPRNPVDILHEAQRISRNLAHYRNQISFMENDLRHSKADDLLTDLAIDLEDVKSGFETLMKRTDKAVPALLASIAISEGSKASSLTAVALWFAPLSLSISIVSIDGNSRFGGQKFWIWACIAVPLLFVVISVAHLSDNFIERLGRRRGGRALNCLPSTGSDARRPALPSAQYLLGNMPERRSKKMVRGIFRGVSPYNN